MVDERVVVYDQTVARVVVYDVLPPIVKVYDGKQGLRGLPGQDSVVPGLPGDSAFEVAVANGFVGTQAEWVASLKGEPGNDSVVAGPGGKSAYQLAVDAGFVGNEAAWRASLKGDPGNDSTVPGPGVPTGGTVGQKLAKTSGVDFATGWVDDLVFVPKVTVGSTAPVSAGEFAWFQTDGAGNFIDLIVGTS